MNMIIVADSSCDVNEQLLESINIKEIEEKINDKLAIDFVPFKIYVDGVEFIDDKNLDKNDLVKHMHDSPNPIRTSCPSPGDFLNSFMKSTTSFAITISKELSGAYNSAVAAKNIALEQKNKFIHIFNSKSASTGEVLVFLKLIEEIKKGISNNEIVNNVEQYISDMKTYFISEDLGNLIKNGRISKINGLLANILNVKLIMKSNELGEIELAEKVRGSSKVFNRLAEIIESTNVNFSERIAVISHANAIEKALGLKEKLEKLRFKDIIIVETNGLSTSYVNDGGVIISF